jgi:hypothetical protein
MFMPTPPLHDDQTSTPAKTRVLRQILDFLRAMRTATSASPDEAIEWATLEQEFTQRTSDSYEKAA